jgi:signal transduction histidine kinase
MPSLRNRLWLSYAALVAVLTLTVGTTLLWSLLRSPLWSRTAVAQLRQISVLAVLELADAESDQVAEILTRTARRYDLRLAVLAGDGQTLFDSAAAFQQPTLAVAVPAARLQVRPEAPVRSVRDAQNRVWFYILQPLGDGEVLLTAMPRPQQSLRGILRDEMLGPLIFSGAAALVLAFIFSVFLTRWIARPLQELAASARAMTRGEYSELQPAGPREVLELTRSLNELSQQVQSSQQAQRDLVANISHELKTPITAIQGFSQAILDGTVASPEELREAATVMNVESDRMHRLVADLLTLTRLEGGIADLHLGAVDLNALVAHTQSRFSLPARQAGIELAVVIGEIPPVNGDGERLAQVLANLVDNALKHTPAGGKITLSTAREGESALIRVTDTGPGIPLEEQERIFERFYQLDKSRRGGSGRGVGLGLPIAREIVRAHAGTIRVESAPQAGSTFIVKLPPGREADANSPAKAGNA